MDSNSKIKEPILVKNPFSDRFVNIAPLFEAMRDFEGPKEDSALNLKAAISQAIRYVNLTGAAEAADLRSLRDVNLDLYRLEDMFKAMAEFQQS